MKPRMTDLDSDDEKPDVLDHVDPGTLVPSPFHRRTIWGDMKSFAALLEGVGVIEPIIVRVVDGEHEIVVGHRRQRGSVMAKLETVPIIIRTLLDEEVVEIQAAENMKREDLHPLDECAYYEMLLERGHDHRSLSRRFSRPVDAIRECLKLAALAPMARAAYGAGAVTAYAARYLCQLMPAQQGALVAAIKSHAITDDGIPGWIRRHALVSLIDVPWSMTAKTAGKGTFSGGACSTCPKRAGGGQRALFAEITGDDASCADPACWREKMEMVAEVDLERAKASGMTVATGKPDSVFLVSGNGRPSVIRSSGFLDAEAESTVPGMTWLEAAASAGITPAVTVRRDQDGRVRYLVLEADVAGKVRRAARDTETPTAQAEAAADPARAEVRAKTKAVTDAMAELLADVLGVENGKVTNGSSIDLDDVVANSIPLALSVVSMTSARAVARAANLDVAALDVNTDGMPARERLVLALLVAEAGASDPAVRALADEMSIKFPPE